MTVAKTKEHSLGEFSFHLVIYDLTDSSGPQLAAHSVIPDASQKWNHPLVSQRGLVVKLAEYPVQNGAQGQSSSIMTVVNDHDGGFTLHFWEFHLTAAELLLRDTRVLEETRGAVCSHFDVAGCTYHSQLGPHLKLVTCNSSALTPSSFLQFWTYSLNNHDLFLDKSIEFDSPLSVVQTCPDLTGFIFVQRQRFQNEIMLFSKDGEIFDRVDQSSPIEAVVSYQADLLLLKLQSDLLYFHLPAKKVLRYIGLGELTKETQQAGKVDIQLTRGMGRELLLITDLASTLVDLDHERALA